MKKFTKYIAAAMALATVISTATACSGDTTTSSGGATSAPETTTTEAPRETVKEDENVNSAVESAIENVSEDYKGIEVNRKLVWMAWNNWVPQENSPEVTMFKSLYGTPTEKPSGFDSIPDENVFCGISSPYADRYVD
ncbi:MAG: carbohydrate ABC transporter substrate-binding protein, CUT1 family, partial [Ruminiclostridium sp.]|nr:carbohydrate ABC transporter substrate-binding protein, CUT1 family [Ruminiclostridium sp.]